MNEHDEKPKAMKSSRSFSVGRFVFSAVGGAVGSVLGVGLGLYGGAALDSALGHPMGTSDGFIPIGHLTGLCVMVLPVLGPVLGAWFPHGLAGGRGRWWMAFLGSLLGAGGVVLVSLPGRGLVFPSVVLIPLGAALLLEFDQDHDD